MWMCLRVKHWEQLKNTFKSLENSRTNWSSEDWEQCVPAKHIFSGRRLFGRENSFMWTLLSGCFIELHLAVDGFFFFMASSSFPAFFHFLISVSIFLVLHSCTRKRIVSLCFITCEKLWQFFCGLWKLIIFWDG